MKIKKQDTFVFDGLGFPVKFINFPMKRVLGEWAIDVDMDKLMVVVLEALAKKPVPLTGDELHFIRSYLKMTATAFGRAFGVSHAAVLKWESGKSRMAPPLELCIRLYILDRLQAKDKEFRALYKKLSLESLSKKAESEIIPLTIDSTTEGLRVAL